jgi:hypothetical protein
LHENSPKSKKKHHSYVINSTCQGKKIKFREKMKINEFVKELKMKRNFKYRISDGESRKRIQVHNYIRISIEEYREKIRRKIM